MTSTHKSYNELRQIATFEDRYEYLRLKNEVGVPTFGFDRYLNQLLYRSTRWKRTRDQVIIRDNGCDLALEGFQIGGQIIVHHMNPITPEDIEEGNDRVFNISGLVCVSANTHLAIHFGNKSLLVTTPITRYPGDTTPWRKI